MPCDTTVIHELKQLLLNELALGRLLQHQLEHERTLLLGGPAAEALQGSAKAKSTTLQHLNHCANARLEWMDSHQLPLAEAFLQHPAVQAEPAVAILWQQLADQYRLNRDLSERMGELVLAARRRVQKRLEILHGQSERRQLLYNKQGQRHSLPAGRGYIQA